MGHRAAGRQEPGLIGSPGNKEGGLIGPGSARPLSGARPRRPRGSRSRTRARSCGPAERCGATPGGGERETSLRTARGWGPGAAAGAGASPWCPQPLPLLLDVQPARNSKRQTRSCCSLNPGSVFFFFPKAPSNKYSVHEGFCSAEKGAWGAVGCPARCSARLKARGRGAGAALGAGTDPGALPSTRSPARPQQVQRRQKAASVSFPANVLAQEDVLEARRPATVSSTSTLSPYHHPGVPGGLRASARRPPKPRGGQPAGPGHPRSLGLREEGTQTDGCGGEGGGGSRNVVRG